MCLTRCTEIDRMPDADAPFGRGCMLYTNSRHGPSHWEGDIPAHQIRQSERREQ